LRVERWNRLHPNEPEQRPYVLQALEGAEGPIIAATDYMKIVPDQLSPWLRGRLVSLGTDGFGRSDNREHLRRFFEISAEAIAAAALSRLARDGKFDGDRAASAVRELGLDPDSADPATR
jgi:pyruvate dehydrogenase E1 component